MTKEKTIASDFYVEGIALHTGKFSSLHFWPAPPSSGIIFRRIDLDGCPKIPANISFVTNTSRQTTISSQNAEVHTIEHVCSALFSFGITNVIIDINGNEPPVMDGSSIIYCNKLNDIGFQKQDANVNILKITKSITYNEGDVIIQLEPSDQFIIDYTFELKHKLF